MYWWWIDLPNLYSIELGVLAFYESPSFVIGNSISNCWFNDRSS